MGVRRRCGRSAGSRAQRTPRSCSRPTRHRRRSSFRDALLRTWRRRTARLRAREAVLSSYARLCAQYDAIMVSAGEPAEINLRDRQYGLRRLWTAR
jgi:hypothetical protein